VQNDPIKANRHSTSLQLRVVTQKHTFACIINESTAFIILLNIMLP
jgi:hypothetical protein